LYSLYWRREMEMLIVWILGVISGWVVTWFFMDGGVR
jgi:hypothetical protein